MSILSVCLDAAYPAAKIPERGSAGSAGLDLFAAEAVKIKAGGRDVVSTGLRMAIPPGCYGRIAPRSGLAVNYGLDVGAGVIDADYRGIIGVLLFNFGESDYLVRCGDRIAQVIIETAWHPQIVVEEVLGTSVRGAQGFGSTGR